MIVGISPTMHFQWIQQLDWSMQISELISNCPSPDASTSDLTIIICDEVLYHGQSPKSARLVSFLCVLRLYNCISHHETDQLEKLNPPPPSIATLKQFYLLKLISTRPTILYRIIFYLMCLFSIYLVSC